MRYVEQFQKLHINKSHGAESPHKPAMLLAVIDALAAREVPANRIEFTPDLIERFRGYFDLAATERDHAHAHYPFFHMKSEPFWTLAARDGREAMLEAMPSARSARHITENVDHAELDPAVYEMMQSPDGRAQLRDAIVERYFPAIVEQVRKRITLEEQSDHYANHIAAAQDDTQHGEVAESSLFDSIPDEIRDRGFRKRVVPAYDYRCAACGLRIFREGETIVDACHLIPVSATRDDDPRNGIALCKNHHWSMDRNWIAPGPDHKWNASKKLDDRIDGERELLDLNGRPLVGPVQSPFVPREDALVWRRERLA